MKYINYIKYCMLTMSLALVGISFVACDDDIELKPQGNYNNIDGIYGSVKNVTGARNLSTITIFGSGTGNGQLYFELTEQAAEPVTVKLKVDKQALETYNAANGTSYRMYPEAQVAIENNGTVNIAAGSQKSEVVNVSVTSNGEVGSTYALPVSAEVTVGGVSVSKANQSYIYLINPLAAIPDSDKGTGIKTVVYIEVNDENILNAGEYTMAGSGKPFFDVVNIFAANINYDRDKKRAYIHCNENVSYILKNADQFIRPLQAKGIKVCLTILGNHDEAGVANLSAEAAVDFAHEIKSYMDVYGLDGVDFDDEYSKYEIQNPSPGFVAPSGTVLANLVYECRKAMPDKIISVYDFSRYIPNGSFDGKGIGTYMDYSYWGAYAGWSDRSSLITGLGEGKYGPSSFNLDFSTGNGGYRLSDCEKVRGFGYGIQMFYNLKAKNYKYSEIFNKIGSVLFDDNVVWTGRVYSKNEVKGEIFIPSYESYLGTWKLTPSEGLLWDNVRRNWKSSDKVTHTLRIEENVKGESYKVYGWGATGDDLPFVMNYTDFGRVEINLPQTVTDPEGVQWQYVARRSSSFSLFLTNKIEPAFSGYLDSSGGFVMRSMKSEFIGFRTMAPAQFMRGYLYDLYGGVYQDVVYEPFSLSKK